MNDNQGNPVVVVFRSLWAMVKPLFNYRKPRRAWAVVAFAVFLTVLAFPAAIVGITGDAKLSELNVFAHAAGMAGGILFVVNGSKTLQSSSSNFGLLTTLVGFYMLAVAMIFTDGSDFEGPITNAMMLVGALGGVVSPEIEGE